MACWPGLDHIRLPDLRGQEEVSSCRDHIPETSVRHDSFKVRIIIVLEMYPKRRNVVPTISTPLLNSSYSFKPYFCNKQIFVKVFPKLSFGIGPEHYLSKNNLCP